MSARGGQGNGVVVRQSFFSGGMASIAVATGLLLDVVAAAVFGAGRDTDAFVAAARFPLALTAILMLLSTQVLVPTFTTWEATLERVRAKRLVTSTLLASVVLGSAVAGVLMLAATPMVAVMAPGFEDSQRTLAAELLRIMVWTIPLTAGCEVLRAWLNSRHMFVVPAAMTVILNVTAAAIVVVVRGDITILPIAYVAGSIAQFVLMFLYAVARGLRLGRPVRHDAEVTRLSRLTVRPSIAATLNPIVRAAELFVASFLPPGTATVLHYAHRLVHAIGGTVLFRQIMTAVLPRLTRAFVAKDKKAEVALGNLGLHLLVSVSFPLTALGVVLAVPAATTVFAIGRFSDHDARMLGLVIAVLSLSFIPSAVQRALLLPYYAVRDTKVPLRNSVYGALANVALLPVCVLPFINSDSAEEYALLGLGAAYVLSNVVNVVHAWWRLRHSNLPMPRISGRHVLRATAASVVGASWAWVVMAEMPHHLPGGAPIRLLIAGTAGMIPVLLLEGLPPLLRRRAARKVEKEARAEQEAKAAKTARENVEAGAGRPTASPRAGEPGRRPAPGPRPPRGRGGRDRRHAEHAGVHPGLGPGGNGGSGRPPGRRTPRSRTGRRHRPGRRRTSRRPGSRRRCCTSGRRRPGTGWAEGLVLEVLERLAPDGGARLAGDDGVRLQAVPHQALGRDHLEARPGRVAPWIARLKAWSRGRAATALTSPVAASMATMAAGSSTPARAWSAATCTCWSRVTTSGSGGVPGSWARTATAAPDPSTRRTSADGTPASCRS